MKQLSKHDSYNDSLDPFNPSLILGFNHLMESDSRKQSWTQFVLQHRIFQFSETALAI